MEMKLTHVIGVLLLAALSEARFLEGRYRRALPPAYLSVEGHQQCLATFQASDSHTEKCLPLKPLTECPVQTWSDLQAVLSDGKPQKKKITSRAVQPNYLSIEGHQVCLGEFQASETHTEKCLPLQKPLECEQSVWDLLVTEFEDANCPAQKVVGGLAGLPPAYLTVNGYQECLLTVKASESHQGYCFPESKPDECEQDSYDELKNVFQGPTCPAEARKSRQIRAGPPAYLSVPSFAKCLGEHKKPGDTHTERCLPLKKPNDCPDASWNQLQTVFEGDKCLDPGRSSRQIRASPPAYLSVPSFEKCLSDHQKPGDSHREWCTPSVKPSDCPDASWDKLNEVFTGNKCLEQNRASRQTRAGPPAYLSVPLFAKCLGEHQKPGDTHTERCLPLKKPNDCPDASWNQLQTVFEGDKCLDPGRASRQSRAGPPAYLSVPSFEKCLGTHQKPGDTHAEKCLPSEKPSSCPNASWNQLKTVFQGDKCLQQGRTARQRIGLGAPEYLQVDNFQDCLGEHQRPGATHTERCLPEVKPDACPEASWEKLGQVFTGDKCLEQERESRQVGLGAPEYLQVENFQDCLGVHQRPGATHTERCLPEVKPDECPDASWEKLGQVFTGDKCLDQERESRQVGLGAPEYLQVENFLDCLGVHQRPEATFTERCLPEVKPDACPEASWEKLGQVFTGDKCLKEERKSRVLTLAVLPPVYLSVVGHEKCLSVHQPSSTHAEKCLPQIKPDDCSDSAWSDLLDVFEGIRCPKQEKIGGPTGLPPAYLSVEGHENCLDVHQASASHSEKCLPPDQPEECSDDAWKQLENVFDGIQCPPLGTQPPAYLFVEKFDNCLELYKPSPSHSEYCLPQFKPEACASSSWSELLTLFEGIRCPALQDGQVSQNPPHIAVGGLPPAYLGVDGHQNCLGSQASILGSLDEKCLPLVKPKECSAEAWKKLSEVFIGNPCSTQPPVLVGGPSSLPPAYLNVAGHEDCLDVHQPTQTYSEKCLPQFQPADCSGQAWRKLNQVFDGIRCSTGKNLAASQSAFLSIDGQDSCLGYHQIDDDHTVKCLPYDQPAGCENQAWQQLQTAFTGIGCPKDVTDVVAAGAPAYLSIEGHEFCLGTYRASETHTEKCLPREKLEDCDDSAWEALPKVFTGIKCPNSKPRAGSSPVVDLSRSSNQLPEGYQTCIGEQLASENHMEKCLPDSKPEACSETAWDELESSFFGSQCRRQPNALPPHYLSIQGHENCLETLQASETHTEVCLPRLQPEECPLDAWESLQISYEGNTCREGRAEPFPDLPTSFQSIAGSKECLRLFQITQSHQASCLPLTRPQGCSQEAFDALQDLAFSAQLPRDARQAGPTGVGALPPPYLSVEGHQLCLGSHQASETHKEVCLPANKPADCSDDSWAKIKAVFVGEACRTGRQDDHVNFPESPQGPGHKVDVVHRPGVEAEIPLAFCNTDGDCFSNDREQICNLFFFAVNDNSGTSWDGVCVPSFCDSLGKCPLVGNVATGAVSGRCKRRSQTCQYDQSLILIQSR